MNAHMALGAKTPAVAPALKCITVLTVVFFSVYVVVVFVRACRRVASCAHEHLNPMLLKVAEALTLVPILCILMITARQRATQVNPARGDPQPWAQTCMYASVASLLLRIVLIMVDEAMSPSETQGGRAGADSALGDGEGKERTRKRESAQDYALLAGHILTSLALYSCCVAIVVSIAVMRRPHPNETPPLTPMMLCSTLLTVIYIVQYMVLEAWSLLGSGTTGQDAGKALEIPSPSGDAKADAGLLGSRREDEAYIKIEPVTLQFIPMFCVLLVGISMRAVQLNLQPDKWACAAMYLTTTVLVIQAIAVPIFRYVLPPEDVAELTSAQEDPSCFPSPRKSDDETSSTRIPMFILTASWSYLMVFLYVGITGTLVTVFLMEAEPLDAVWPEKKIGLLEEFLRHLEKSRHLMENEALSALSTAAVPPISSAMRCTMLLTVLYFGVFLGVLVGRTVCGPVRKRAAAVNDAVDELRMAAQTLSKTKKGLREREARDPELSADVVTEQTNRELGELEEKVKEAKAALHTRSEQLVEAKISEAQVREGVQRSLAFVPMLCVIMIAVRMRAMQVRVRDPQPWAQVTMYVATSAVTTQVLASILYACFVRADDMELSCSEVGVVGKVIAIIILVVRYISAISLYIAMIALVVALVSMQHENMMASN